MAIVDLIMPKLGESIIEATVLKWNKNIGDAIQQDETVLEIATDKVDSEVPSTASGIISEILFNVNDVVPIGTVIAKIDTGSNGSTITKSSATTIAAKEIEPISKELPEVPFVPASVTIKPSGNGKFYSPLVLNIANSEGISLSELENISGTGNEGRVSKKDLLQYVASKKSGVASAASVSNTIPASVVETTTKVLTAQPPSAVSYSSNVEIIEMDRMRKLISDHMVMSKHTSPHVTSFVEADVTNIVNWRNKLV